MVKNRGSKRVLDDPEAERERRFQMEARHKQRRGKRKGLLLSIDEILAHVRATEVPAAVLPAEFELTLESSLDEAVPCDDDAAAPGGGDNDTTINDAAVPYCEAIQPAPTPTQLKTPPPRTPPPTRPYYPSPLAPIAPPPGLSPPLP